MPFDEVGILGHGVAQRVEERGLEPREGVVESVDAGPCEPECLGISLLGQTVDHRAAGIGEPHDLCALVESLAGGVVDRRADDLHPEGRVHTHDLRVPAADEQAEEREIGVRELPVGEVYEVREDMPLEVVDLDHRDVPGDRESLRERDADEERPHQSGAAGEGDGVDVVDRDSCLLERRVDHGDDVLLVGPGGQFGDDSSVFDVHGLGGDDVRQQDVVAQHGGGGVVAGGFDSENCDIHIVFSLFFADFCVSLLVITGS